MKRQIISFNFLILTLVVQFQVACSKSKRYCELKDDPVGLCGFGDIQVPGAVSNIEELKKQPRAIIGYLSDKQWAIQEFLHMSYASWFHATREVAKMKRKNKQLNKMDLIVFGDERWTDVVAAVCKLIDLKKYKDKDFDFLSSKSSQCFFIPYPLPDRKIWFDYPFVNNVHFFADPTAARLFRNYGMIMKSDLDVFFPPSLWNYWPQKMVFGVQEYVVLDETRLRLLSVSEKLGLTHQQTHNMGPFWYGETDQLITMANFSLPVLYHIVTHEFPQLPGGGIAQKWQQGEGWPQWGAGVGALYATEIAANHIVKDFGTDLRMDSHGDANVGIDDVYHIHCRHGDGDFSKFEFFKHQYQHVDIGKLDTSIVKDFAMFLAAGSWRLQNAGFV